MGLMDHMNKPDKESQSEEQITKDRFSDLKVKIHHALVEKIDFTKLEKIEKGRAALEVQRLVESLLDQDGTPLNRFERTHFIKEISDEVFGFGPLEPLLNDQTVDDILVNGPNQVFAERFGKLVLTDVKFRDENHLRQIIDRIVSRVGRRIDEGSPMVDARLPDGSRVNAIIPPLALNGSSLSIRKFRAMPLSAEDLVRFGSWTEEVSKILQLAVKGRFNLLISGGTGTGKTTMLNIMSSYISDTERIVTIEDAAELRLMQKHVVRLETRPPNVEGKGEIDQRALVRNALRMRPDRIIVGEVRGGEALDMLQAMNTGHEGSITTVHANTPRDAIGRIETMVLYAGTNLTHHAIMSQIVSAIHLIIQLKRCSDGVRRLDVLSEVCGMEGDIVSLQDIMTFQQTGVSPTGEVLGKFVYNHVRPVFLEKLKVKGLLPEGLNLPAWGFGGHR
jgi:pilus assembly protein CpaF